MHFYDPTQKTHLTVDASPTGLGAILSNIEGNLHNVAYACRSLTPTECRYSQTEREAMAVVWGCERFHLYLIGAELSISTDHKALEVIYQPKSKPPARIQRWVLRLQQYKSCARKFGGLKLIRTWLSIFAIVMRVRPLDREIRLRHSNNTHCPPNHGIDFTWTLWPISD